MNILERISRTFKLEKCCDPSKKMNLAENILEKVIGGDHEPWWEYRNGLSIFPTKHSPIWETLDQLCKEGLLIRYSDIPGCENYINSEYRYTTNDEAGILAVKNLVNS